MSVSMRSFWNTITEVFSNMNKTSPPINTDERLWAMDVKVFEKMLEQLTRVTFNSEYLFYLTHLQKTNPHFSHPALEAAVKRYNEQKLHRANELKWQRHELNHWRKLVKQYSGKTVYVQDNYGIRAVVLHGPAHNNGVKVKGTVEIRDDAWFRLNNENCKVGSYLNAHAARWVNRSKERFVVRRVLANLIHTENPYKDEPAT